MNKIEAIRLLKIYTANKPQQYYWQLTGSSKRTVRNHILSVLLEEKVKCGQDGITRLEEELFKAFNVNKNQCLAGMRDELNLNF